MINYTFPYWGPLLFKTSLNVEQVKSLEKICNKNESFHTKLAGHIKEEYLLDNIKYEKIVGPQLNLFKDAYTHFYNKPSGNLKTKNVWVNYMKAGEYNPPHVHGGCDFSSVIYTNVPEEIKKEILQHKATSSGPGTIEFFYGENLMHFNSWISYLPEKGDMFIFPSHLRHFVSPFKSKGVIRTSIAANFIMQ